MNRISIASGITTKLLKKYVPSMLIRSAIETVGSHFSACVVFSRQNIVHTSILVSRIGMSTMKIIQRM